MQGRVRVCAVNVVKSVARRKNGFKVLPWKTVGNMAYLKVKVMPDGPAMHREYSIVEW